MRRIAMILTALAVLAVPMIVGADDQGWMPPEWTATPPAKPNIQLEQLVQLLVTKGIISDHDYAQLTHPQVSSSTQQGHARVWTWDEIDHNPVLRAGRSGGD